jgi:hypothetical protein
MGPHANSFISNLGYETYGLSALELLLVRL